MNNYLRNKHERTYEQINLMVPLTCNAKPAYTNYACAKCLIYPRDGNV